MVPGDAVAVPRGWWHAVRSTPSSMAISVAVLIETLDERTKRRCMCRRDVQLTVAPREVSNVRLGSGRASNSQRADSAIVDNDTIVHYYALCDKRLAESCLVLYERLEGRVIKWHTGDGLRYFVEAAVADLGLSARHVNAVTEWMINFQQRPILGGMVLAEESGDTTRGMVVSPAEQQVGADGVEQLQEVRMQLPPVDAHTVGGELRVYTRPLDCGAALDERRGGIVRYAVHDVVHTEGMTIVDRSPSSEAHAAVVVCQHGNG